MRFLCLFFVGALFGLAAKGHAEDRLGVGAKFDELEAGDRTYESVTVTAVRPDRISISHASGFANVAFEALSQELQKRFGYNPEPQQNFAVLRWVT